MGASHKLQIDSLKLSQASASWVPGTDGWDIGTITLPDHGMVSAYMQGDSKHRPLTRVDFVLDGRYYMVTAYKRYSRRGVIGFARRAIYEAGIPV